jgi:aspartate/methionine/tyrosine aminotransferase
MAASRAVGISSFIVMDVLEKAHEMERTGVDVIHLEVGEPDFDTPLCIQSAAKEALEAGCTHYTHSLGLFELREAVCEHYQEHYGVSITPERVLITAGTSPAMLILFGALLEAGDEVIISDPHYACYPNLIRFFGGVPVTVPVHEADGFQFRTKAVKEKISSRTRAVLINSPSNPTGTMLSKERMQALSGLLPRVISDEIYHGLVYRGRAHSMLEYREDAIVFNGFSKLYAMTGWRLGYVIAPKDLIRPMQKIHQNFFISANAAVQKAGIAALKAAGPDVDRMREIYNERRQFMVARLREIGFGVSAEPTGAFYVFANARHLSSDSYALAFELLENAHVGVAPGIDFGKKGEGYIRFSYANSLGNIEAGLDRIEGYLAGRPPGPGKGGL